MIGFWRFVAGATVALAVSTSIPENAVAQVKVMTSGGFAAPLREMLPEFEKSSGLSVEVILGKSQGGGPDTISCATEPGRGGRHCDPVAGRPERSDIGKQDCRPFRHRPGQDAPWHGGSGRRSETGHQHGRSLQECAAPRQVHYLSQQHDRHLHGHQALSATGNRDAVLPKSSNAGVAAVAKGDIEIAIQPVSEVLHVPGTDFVGTLPPGDPIYLGVLGGARCGVGQKQRRREADHFSGFGKGKRTPSAIAGWSLCRRIDA